jgi:hypothetical protein
MKIHLDVVIKNFITATLRFPCKSWIGPISKSYITLGLKGLLGTNILIKPSPLVTTFEVRGMCTVPDVHIFAILNFISLKYLASS